MLDCWRQTVALVALKSKAAIQREVMAYLSANPTAQDTLEGIVAWWLLEQKIEEAASGVKAALAKLVKEKKLSAKKGPDGRVHYRLKPRETKARGKRRVLPRPKGG
jgi:hypothetical protein